VGLKDDQQRKGSKEASRGSTTPFACAVLRCLFSMRKFKFLYIDDYVLHTVDFPLVGQTLCDVASPSSCFSFPFSPLVCLWSSRHALVVCTEEKDRLKGNSSSDEALSFPFVVSISLVTCTRLADAHNLEINKNKNRKQKQESDKNNGFCHNF
jgi:hypothetical protein